MNFILFHLSLMKWMVIVFIIIYLPKMMCWFAPFKKQKRLFNQKQNKLAIIIPARNEGTAVLPLFQSILNQTYNRRNFDCYVVVKDKNDPVIELAKMINATVFIDEAQNSKGDCLNYAIKSILRTNRGKYDGYIITDADCEMKADFLEEMNHAMASGAQVINAKKTVKNYFSENNYNNNWVTACNGLIWTLIDEMGNRYKSDHGFTTMTITTGILITKDLIESWNGWPYLKTLTEDMELQRDCGVKDYKTFYYSYAQIMMEESPSHRETNKRRTRWMTGLIDADKIYYPELKNRKSLYNIRNNYFLYCLWVSYAFIGGLTLIMVSNFFLAMLTLYFNKACFLAAVKVSFTAFRLIYLSFFVPTSFALVIDWKYIRLTTTQKLLLLLIHPLFYMEYIKIVAKAVFLKSPDVWEEIERVNVSV